MDQRFDKGNSKENYNSFWDAPSEMIYCIRSYHVRVIIDVEGSFEKVPNKILIKTAKQVHLK